MGTGANWPRLRRKGRRVLLAVFVCAIAASIAGYAQHIEGQRAAGGAFGVALKGIQDDLVLLQEGFEAAQISYTRGDIAESEFISMAKMHLADLEMLVVRYGELEPPASFAASVELFKLSTEAQLERDRQITLWVETGDEAYNIRADELHQESFSYEIAALASYKTAQSGRAP